MFSNFSVFFFFLDMGYFIGNELATGKRMDLAKTWDRPDLDLVNAIFPSIFLLPYKHFLGNKCKIPTKVFLMFTSVVFLLLLAYSPAAFLQKSWLTLSQYLILRNLFPSLLSRNYGSIFS